MNIPPPGIQQANEKLKNIELLRFFLIWIIVLYHFFQFPKWFAWTADYCFFNTGYMGVELFFIIAFFFQALQTKKEKSWAEFCVSKWIRLSPLIIVMTLVGYVLYLSGIDPRWSWMDNLLNIFCVQIWVRFPVWSAVPQAYFCSTLFGVSCIYLLLVKSFSKQHLTFIVALLWFVGMYGVVRAKEVPLISAYTNNIVCRAFFCLGIGYLLASAYQNKKAPAIINVALYTLAELGLLAYNAYVLTTNGNGYLWLIEMPAFAALLWMFLIKRGLISRMLDRNWCVVLGRYSYAIFIVHIFVRTMGSYSVRQNWCWGLNQSHPILFISLMCGITMVLAMMAYHLIEVPVIKWYKNRNKAQRDANSAISYSRL